MREEMKDGFQNGGGASVVHDAKRAQRRERKREREGVECKRERPGY